MLALSKRPVARRIPRFLGVAVLALVGLTCRDKDLMGPGLPQRARLAVVPHFAVATSEMPTIRLSKVKAEVFRLPSGDHVLDDSAFFAPNDTSLELSLTVGLLDRDEQFRVRISAWDESTPPNLVFIGEDTMRAAPMNVPQAANSVRLRYAGPDSVVKALSVQPRPDTVITLGDSTSFRAFAKRSDSSVVVASIGWTSRDTNVITIDRNTGVAYAKGEGANVWIIATSFTGKQDSLRVSVTQEVASVTVAPSPAEIVVGQSVQLVASVKDAGGRAMPLRKTTWTSADTLVAKVSETGLVTSVAIGSTTIFVSSGAITTRVPVSVIQAPVFRVLIAPVDTTIYIGDQATLRPRVEDQQGNVLTNRPVLWGSLNPGIATVDVNTGRVTAISAGTANISATSEGKIGTATVKVIPIGSVLLTPESDTVAVGDSVKYTAVPRDSNGVAMPNRTITWRTLDPTIATVDSKGMVTGVALGITRLVASSGGRADTSDIRVAPPAPQFDRTEVTPKTALLTSLGDTLKLTAQTYIGQTPVVTTYDWVSRDPSIATVDRDGVVVARGNGSVYIVVQAGGTRDSASIVVQQQVSSVTVTPQTRTLYVGTTFKFSVTAVDGRGNPMPAATQFAWTSSAPSVANPDTSGLVSARAMGTAQIRATAGGVTGTATVTVLSQITRIEVTPASTVLPSLGLSVKYTAVAYDTLNNAMTGVTFAWSSSNPSVAPLDSITANTARAISFANGTTSIRATAQGTTGSAGLTVQQVLAGIEVSPASAVIAPNGSMAMIARGKDANNRYMPVSGVTWSSSSPSFATVNSSTGVVTGVALGTTQITAALGAITSNQAAITVSNQVPPRISFGRDTIGIGRTSSTSIPIYLSTPSATGAQITVNLSAADTVAYFSTSTVVFAPGQTSANVTLNGRNAGTTRIYATDAGGVYAGDTAVVTVQAAVRIAVTNISLNASDSYSTQVLLSDPSPAGGTYVTFAYGTPGIASVSPDPAFIPAGQLAADIVVRGNTGGSTTITPSAAGVNGTSTTVNVAAAKLNFNITTQRLGVGQYEPNNYVYVPNNLNNSLTITLTSDDSTIARTPKTVIIPGGSNYVYFELRGLSTGSSRIIASAPGWTPDTINTIVTTPRIGITGGTTLNTTSPARTLTVYAEDSLRTAHYRINSLVVSLRSSDTTVMKVLDSTVTIAAGQYYNQLGRAVPTGAGTAWIIASAGGHSVDSTHFSVVGPKIQFSYTNLRLGAGQMSGPSDVYVYVPDNVKAPLTIALATPDTNLVGVPASVTIPAGSNYAYFNVRGKARTGSFMSVIASATNYQPDTSFVHVSSPRVTSSGGTTLNAFSSPRSFTIYTTDSVGTAHYVIEPQRFTLVSSDTNVIKIDSSAITVPAGAYFTNVPKVVAVGVGTAKIYVTGPAGWINDSSQVYTVVAPKLNVSFGSANVGLRQYAHETEHYVYTPDNRTDTLRITVTQKHPERVRLIGGAATGEAVITPGMNYRYFGYEGIGYGRDTIIFSAPNYLPDTAYVMVTSSKFTTGNLPSSATTTSNPSTVYVYAADSLGTAHYVMDTVTVRVTSSDSTVIKPESTYIHMVRGDYYETVRVRYVGPGTASLTFSDSAGVYAPVTTNTVTVTGPSLRMSSANHRLGMRQYIPDAYVFTDNNVTGTPLVVRLVSTDTRVATVPDSVIIPVGFNYAYFRMTAHDTVGTIQIQATATGYSPINTTLQVTQPRFVLSTSTNVTTTTPPQRLTIYATDAFGTGHFVNEDVTVTLSSSAPGVAATDSTTVVIKQGEYYSQAARVRYLSVGQATITASDPRTTNYRYNPGSETITVNTPPIQLGFTTMDLGLGQMESSGSSYVYVNHTAQDTITATLTHVGAAETSTPSTVKILPGTSYTYFRTVANTVGRDTIIVSAPGHNPDTGYVNVGTGTLTVSNWSSSVANGTTRSLTLRTLDQNGTEHAVNAPTTFSLTPSNSNIAFYETATSTTPITSLTVAADASSTTFYMKASNQTGANVGSGVTISRTGYTTYTNTVTVTP